MPALMTTTNLTSADQQPRGCNFGALARCFMALLMVLFAVAPVWAQDKSTGSSGSKPAAQFPVDVGQRAAVEKIVRDYLLANPDVVVEAIRLYREQAEQARQAHAKAALAESRAQLMNDPDSPVGGNPKGDVTIVEFFDYRCGYCKRVLPTIQEIIKTDKNVRIVFKEFPILGDESMVASRAALAAFKINPKKYEAFHNALMLSTGGLPVARVLRLAQELGYDPDALRKVMDSPEIEARIQKNYLLAESLNIRGTPAFVVGNELVPGAVDLEQLRSLIAQARSG